MPEWHFLKDAELLLFFCNYSAAKSFRHRKKSLVTEDTAEKEENTEEFFYSCDLCYAKCFPLMFVKSDLSLLIINCICSAGDLNRHRGHRVHRDNLEKTRSNPQHPETFIGNPEKDKLSLKIQGRIPALCSHLFSVANFILRRYAELPKGTQLERSPRLASAKRADDTEKTEFHGWAVTIFWKIE